MRSLKQRLSSDGFSVPSFPPHITVTSGLNWDQLSGGDIKKEEIATAFNKLSIDTQKLTIDELEFNDNIYFKNVVLNITKDKSFLEFIGHLRDMLVPGREIDSWIQSYQPHLSLVYSDVRYDEQKNIADDISQMVHEIIKDGISIDIDDCILEIVRCEGPVEQWLTIWSSNALQ